MRHETSSGYVWTGVRDLLPMIPGVLPFGLIAGANGVALGFSPEMVVGMTVLFFAGSAQLVVYQMLQDGVVPALILLTALMVNLRFAIYSANFAPLLHHLPLSRRWLLAYLISDQAYGLCTARRMQQLSAAQMLGYYRGAAWALWCSWTLSVVIGILLGSRIPASWSLEFAIPLAFLAMLVGTLTNRTMLLIALVAGAAALYFRGLPYNLGFIVAVSAGVAFGLVLSRVFKQAAGEGA